jgi:hypothetical protein
LLTGAMTQCGDSFFWPTVPTTMEEFIRVDPLTRTCENRYGGSCRVIVSEDMPWSGEIESMHVGYSFESNSHPHLRFLENCGYVESEPLYVTRSGAEGLLYLKKSVFSLDQPVYTYKVTDPIPEKFNSF